MKELLREKKCSCGKIHKAEIEKLFIGSGVINNLSEIIREYSFKKPFILADKNTFSVAGKTVCNLLDNSGTAYKKYIFERSKIEPDEYAVGSALMHFDCSCDVIIGVGSGVINDIGKILAANCGKKYIIVATAPSMDGYASTSSSVIRDDLKLSLDTKCAEIIIGDTDILKNAPLHMLKAGIGDMLAKYVSIAEWRIGNLITGEYYCEEVADIVRKSVEKCVENAPKLMERDANAVEAVFRGLVMSGIAMAYTGISRPASGTEHYFSHIWDMRAIEFGTKSDLHGIQCAVGTLICIKLYEALKRITPDREKALKYVKGFSLEKWHETLKELLGKSSKMMIELEKTEKKYDKVSHPERLDLIVRNYGEILKILKEELPKSEDIEKLFDVLGMPGLEDLDVSGSLAEITFKSTKDIRDKYILSRLVWDLGEIDDLWSYMQ